MIHPQILSFKYNCIPIFQKKKNQERKNKENNQIELIQKIRHHLGDQTNRETYNHPFILLLHKKQKGFRRQNTKS